MTCENAQQLFPDLWAASLNQTDRVALEGHLASCEACRAEAASLGRLWTAMENLPLELPSKSVRERVEWAIQGAEAVLPGTSSHNVPKRAPSRKTFLSWWPSQPAFQFAAAAACLVVGVAGGLLLPRGPLSGALPSSEVAQLRQEIRSTRQMVALSLMQQQSAADRLRGVDYSYRIPQPEAEVTEALLHTVGYDESVNVRLAAVDALHRVSTTGTVRQDLLSLLPKQDSPLVQIAIIDLLADIRETQAVETLNRMARDPQINAGVRRHAKEVAQQLTGGAS